jgi:endonuclease/exonuclease/phosphatase family metal-dependent hydrolase
MVFTGKTDFYKKDCKLKADNIQSAPMKKWYLLAGFLFLGLIQSGCVSGRFHADAPEINVLSLNIWQEGTRVENGFDYIIDEIEHLKPDLVAFSEVRNYNDTDFIGRVVEALARRGLTYYGEKSVSTGIISKYPIQSQESVSAWTSRDNGSALKALIEVQGRPFAFYSLHLDWRHYACYLPRGYGSSTWKKVETRVTDVEEILKDSNESFRDEIVEMVLADAEQERLNGRRILICGDFNEPSHLDWQADTAQLRDHNGVVINWDLSTMLHDSGYQDSYRVIHPNPVTHPGFTFPANNLAVPVSSLACAPEVDERDRIDFIYYGPKEMLRAVDSRVVAPAGDILRNERVPDDSEDPFIVPLGGWPTDHKGVLTRFRLDAAGSARSKLFKAGATGLQRGYCP